jgi:hypothetical protein
MTKTFSDSGANHKKLFFDTVGTVVQSMLLSVVAFAKKGILSWRSS